MKQIIAVIFLVFVVIIGMNYVSYLDPNNQNQQVEETLSDNITSDSDTESTIDEIVKVKTGTKGRPKEVVLKEGKEKSKEKDFI